MELAHVVVRAIVYAGFFALSMPHPSARAEAPADGSSGALSPNELSPPPPDKNDNEKADRGGGGFCDESTPKKREQSIDVLSQKERKDNGLDADSIWEYFSPALLVSYYGAEVVGKAEVRNGIVRVLEEARVSTEVGVQAFYPLGEWTYVRSNDCGKTWAKYSQTGLGPYVGVTFSSDDVIDSLSIGMAFSVRRESGGVRLGLGLAIDPDAAFLGSGFSRDGLLPNGEEGVLLENKVALGMQFMISFTPGF